MSEPDDGGPAFPRPGLDGIDFGQDGMSLRDWFAGMALSGATYRSSTELASLTAACYRVADAMIEARKK